MAETDALQAEGSRFSVLGSDRQPDVPQLVDHLFRHQAGQLVATLTRIFGPQQLDLAEDVVQEALLRALRHWPYHGVPDNPAGWLMRVAKNCALDRLRRERRFAERHGELAAQLALAPDPADADEGELRDDMLRLMFTCCHPAISREAQVALTLKTLGGFGVPELARAFLAPEPTIAQRLVRAKKTIRERGVPFEVPGAADLPARLGALLEVLYLLFNEGYGAAQGEELLRRDMCAEAIRLAAIVAQHPACDTPTTHALLALLLLLAARLPGRTGAAGDLLTLAEQRRERWDRTLIARGLAELGRASQGDALSPYHPQAAIAALHALAPAYDQTDWVAILEQYDLLMTLAPSPVVVLNRAVALAELRGPQAGLQAIEPLRPSLAGYHLLHAVAASLHQRAGQPAQALSCYRRALELAANEAERRFLARKIDSFG